MAHHADDTHVHIVPVSTYLAIFGALMVFTVVTVLAAFVDLGALNTPLALAIAFFKAGLVVLFFMHVKYGSRLIWLGIGGALYWLAHLLVGTVADYMSRGMLGTPGS